MKSCSKCNCELVDDLEVTASGVYEIGVSYKKRISSNHRGKVRATLCPMCGNVSFYLDKEAIDIVIKDVEK
ncbi:MAG TPA: hypothetical protein VFD03_01710 [Clostridia bacterium]|nr:hypothetical protein [Clostridia bacterium]